MAVRASRLPSHEAMTDAIIAVWYRATPEQERLGLHWYRTAGHIVDVIASDAGSTPGVVAHLIASLSPRNPWFWNVADAMTFALASARGATKRPAATTYNANADKAWAIITGALAPERAWGRTANKVRNFVDAILGDERAVVVDTWAMRVVTRGRLGNVRPAEYEAVKEAYRWTADFLGVTPAGLQAVTWVVAQQEGLGSKRKGRHDLTFKTGTPESLRALLAQGAIA